MIGILKKILGREAEDELEFEISASDGCVGEEIIARVIERLKPC